MMKTRFLLLLSFMLMLSACTSRKNNALNYMLNVDETLDKIALQKAPTTLQTGDQLLIQVSAKDMDVVSPFNQNYSSAEAIATTTSSGNIMVPQKTNTGPMYLVDSEGQINFPVLGKIQVSNLTPEDLQKVLAEKISRYVINPHVNIRLTNFRISVLGEVTRPGEYIIPNAKATVLSALAMAGDLTQFGRRDQVIILRTQNGELSKTTLDLQDTNFIESPFFELKQGDVIYVTPNNFKNLSAKTNPNYGLYLQIISVALTALALSLTLIK